LTLLRPWKTIADHARSLLHIPKKLTPGLQSQDKANLSLVSCLSLIAHCQHSHRTLSWACCTSQSVQTFSSVLETENLSEQVVSKYASHSWSPLASPLASTLTFLVGDCSSSSSSRSSLAAFAAAFFSPRPLSAPGVGEAVGSAALLAGALRLVALRAGVAGSALAPSVAGERVRSFLL